MILKYTTPLIAVLITSFISMLKNDIEETGSSLHVEKCGNFEVTGKGDNPNWNKVDWIAMNPLDNSKDAYLTKFKILYSSKGIYVLAFCEDKLISTQYTQDQGDIWEGDVFEVFLQTDPANPLYFEYEINPLNTELAILVPNNNGDFFGWSPWHYEGERKVTKAVQIDGGKAAIGEKVRSWTAEMFFPFALFKGLKNAPPQSGTIWKGNFYRMDYDGGARKSWGWQPVEINFHEYKKYGDIIFE
jgi:hypothetical protein